MQDEAASLELQKKKKIASKVLLRFVLKYGGPPTLIAFRALLARLDGFAEAYTPRLLESSKLLIVSDSDS